MKWKNNSGELVWQYALAGKRTLLLDWHEREIHTAEMSECVYMCKSWVNCYVFFLISGFDHIWHSKDTAIISLFRFFWILLKKQLSHQLIIITSWITDVLRFCKMFCYFPVMFFRSPLPLRIDTISLAVHPRKNLVHWLQCNLRISLRICESVFFSVWKFVAVSL